PIRISHTPRIQPPTHTQQRLRNNSPQRAEVSNCTTQGLPANALIVDDVPDGTPISRPGCTQPTANSGTFSLDFATPSAKIDFQQLGAGYGGHFWFGHTRNGDETGNRMKVTGTWQITNQPIGQREVFVHLPDHGAQEPQATYEMETRWGTQTKTIDQKGPGNRWVSLGYYDFGDRLAVRLSTTRQNATGDLDLAYDAVAFAPSDYSPLPRIALPEPNPNSLPDFSYDIPEEYDSSGPQLRGSGTSAPRCQSPNSQGKYTCTQVVDPGSYTPPNSAKSLSPSAANAWSPLVPRCATTSKPFSVTRFDACYKRDILVQAWYRNNGTSTLMGTVSFHLLQEIKIPRRAAEGGGGFSNGFNTKVTLELFDVQGTIDRISATGLETYCTVAVCNNSTFANWPEGDTWFGLTDRHKASASAVIQWTNGATDAVNFFDLGASVNFIIPGYKPDDIEGAKWQTVPLGQIRCDSRLSTAPACVMSGHKPVWKLDDQRYPVAAAYYWLLREKLASHPGSRIEKSPLHREADGATAAENRRRVCDRGVAANLEPWSAHPDALGDSRGIQCDEFPFARTRESGGQIYTNGKPCVQLFAKLVNGKWMLNADGRYALPSGATWPQVCGRAAIPGIQNEAAGSDLGNFYLANRMLHDDGFYFESPRYEGCSTTQVCTIP
ncbi:hypothetical protein AB0I68_38820, partial [Streptomyces sp. NPDC050448]